MPNNHLFDKEIGLFETGAITGYDSSNNTLKVRLNSSTAIRGQVSSIDVPCPHSLFYNNGLFIGTVPVPGTPIVVGQGSGGQYYFVSFLIENLPMLPTIEMGKILISANDQTAISVGLNNSINIGSAMHKLHINTSEKYITSVFDTSHTFTQGTRKIEGTIKRDLRVNTNFDSNSKLEDDEYNNKYFTIGLDPSASPNAIVTGSIKNPPFVEQREIIYEFQNDSEVKDELSESLLYGNVKPPVNSFVFPNRRKSRADTLSLTLGSPNYLIESIKGTVVDIFGNILDINRVPLPVGQDQYTIRVPISTDKTSSYLKIRELQRKSIAFHFELNARKDLSTHNGKLKLPDINSNEDYARNRSRLFVDIDKEGLIKFNVPASSEKGNIPLLSRYENYSTIGSEDNNNIDKLVFRDDNLDILHDSFAAPKFDINSGNISSERGSINIDSNGAIGTPIDRITNTHIKHGTAYHDITATCYAHQRSDFLKYVADDDNLVFSRKAINKIPLLNQVVSDTIVVSGDNANAGGRSISANFDGSAEFSIGANTIDRQSLWLDLAGGSIINFGRDKQNTSAALSMNGNVFWQIGGIGVSGDSRFEKYNNGHIGAVLDIRVFNSGLRVTMIRIDDEGIKIMSPGNVAIHSGQNLRLTADGDIGIECENLTLQNRLVDKLSIRTI